MHWMHHTRHGRRRPSLAGLPGAGGPVQARVAYVRRAAVPLAERGRGRVGRTGARAYAEA